MNKKRNTASLIDRFTSRRSTQVEQNSLTPANLSAATDNTSQECVTMGFDAGQAEVSPELLEALNKHRHKNVGRPKAGTNKHQEDKLMYGDTRFTIIVKKELQQKLKYISAIETRTLKDMLDEVLGGYIKKWESSNEVIKLKKTK